MPDHITPLAQGGSDSDCNIQCLCADLKSALAAIASNTGRSAKKLDDVTSQSGGDAIAIVARSAA